MSTADRDLLAALDFTASETSKGWFAARSNVPVTGYYATEAAALKNALPYARALASQEAA